MSFETDAMKIFSHTILITWNEQQQKWQAECLVLDLKIEADSYVNLIRDLIKSLSTCDEALLMQAEQHKPSV